MKPSDETINKTIAEFMGLKYCICSAPIKFAFQDECDSCGKDLKLCPHKFRYTTSIDALVPVMRKVTGTTFSLVYKRKADVWIASIISISINIEDKSPSRALALACYQVIKDQNHASE